MFAKQSYRANSRPKSRQEWPKPLLGKTENATASAARSTAAARDGFGWPARDFEKPIFELGRRLQDLKNHSSAHDVDLDSAVKALEGKLRETRREIYGKVTAWQRVQIARHTQRPFAMDYIERCFTNWIELHGDRRFADDRAMPCGLATLGTQRCVVITHQK